jgi:hypothetical protein
LTFFFCHVSDTLLAANPSKLAGSANLLKQYKVLRDEETLALHQCPELKGVKWLSLDDLRTSTHEKLRAGKVVLLPVQ